MGLWAVAFLGSTPVGGPIIGWIGQNIGPRFGLGLGGIATLLAAAVAYPRLRRLGSLPTDLDGGHPTPTAKLT